MAILYTHTCLISKLPFLSSSALSEPNIFSNSSRKSLKYLFSWGLLSVCATGFDFVSLAFACTGDLVLVSVDALGLLSAVWVAEVGVRVGFGRGSVCASISRPTLEVERIDRTCNAIFKTWERNCGSVTVLICKTTGSDYTVSQFSLCFSFHSVLWC